MDINEGQNSFTLWSKSEYSEFYLLKNQVKNHRIYLDKYSGLWRSRWILFWSQTCSRETRPGSSGKKPGIWLVTEGKVLEGSTIYSDGWKAYYGLILNGYEHYRVYHSHNEFARGKSHINGIESFWSFAKRRLAKFNGLSDETFPIHLKECEFRWNNKDSNLYKILLKLLRDSPLK